MRTSARAPACLGDTRTVDTHVHAAPGAGRASWCSCATLAAASGCAAPRRDHLLLLLLQRHSATQASDTGDMMHLRVR